MGMTDTTHSLSPDHIAGQRISAPHIAGTAVALTSHRYDQHEVARVHDYLRGFPSHTAVLLSVELCSLTLQRDDLSIPALIGACLFGDGAAAVVATGADRIPVAPMVHPGPSVLATRSRLFPGTVD